MPDDVMQAASPVLPESVREVRGWFPSDAALQNAISVLTLAGFDRAALSLPHTGGEQASVTPEQGAENPNTETDSQQMRTLHASMAGSVGALAAAGVVVATGGAAIVGLAAAAAVGGGTGLLAHSASRAADTLDRDDRNTAAAEGRLILSVHTTSVEQQARAASIMRASGATEAHAGERVATASNAWTGG